MRIFTSKIAFVVFKQTEQLTQKSKNVVGLKKKFIDYC